MRVLIAIGCNNYDSKRLTQLGGAELDAERMFNLLMKENVGDYEPAVSTLLLSPTLNEVRLGVQTILFGRGPIDTFTFFFAGHGEVRAGSFHMLLRDTNPDALSATAYSLSDLFRCLGESRPAQSNIIIDACESGGLVSDIGSVLKADIVGDAGTPGFTLVASCAQDRTADETSLGGLGGLGTNAILDCIRGVDFVQDSSPALDLVEIGQRVSQRLRDQAPAVWGLNLYGAPRFCANPRYERDLSRRFRDVIQSWPSASDASLRAHYDSLWRAYASVNDDWRPRKFADVIGASLLPLASVSTSVLAALTDRLAAAVVERARRSIDPYRPCEALAAVAVCLLPFRTDNEVQRSIRHLLTDCGEAVLDAERSLLADLSADRYALLASRGGGLPDLFYLPIRLSKVLGWAAIAAELLPAGDARRTEADGLFRDLICSVLTNYADSIVAMSDSQAPCWSLALGRAHELGLTDEARELSTRLFQTLIACHGRVACTDIPPKDSLRYLAARAIGELDQAAELVEWPNHTLTVLLRAASRLGLSDAFDRRLSELDGVPFVAYMNNDFDQYGCAVMQGGQNFIWTIGRDVFRVGDLDAMWPGVVPKPDSQARPLVLLAALLYPDRVPWFAL